MRAKYFWPFLSLLTACASGPRVENGVTCLNEDAVKSVIPTLEKSVDGLASAAAGGKTTVVSNSCDVRVYERRGYRITLSKRLGDTYGNQLIASVTPVAAASDATPAQCLARARQALKQIHAEYGLAILDATSKKISPAQATNNAAKWLQCIPGDTAHFYDSISGMVHELNHDLRQESCLSGAEDRQPLCFHLPRNLPPNSIARLPSYPTRDKNSAKSLEAISDTYLVNAPQNFLLLLDELNSYILTTRTASLSVYYAGGAAFSNRGAWRPYLVQPLVQTWVLRYLMQLKEFDPGAYHDIMDDPRNVKSLRHLLDYGESVYAGWVTAMEKEKVPFVDFEIGLWAGYLALKKQIFPDEASDK